MSRVKHQPEWYVFVEDFNGKKIEKFNVFHSHRFIEGCKQAVKQYKKDYDIAKLEKEIHSWAVYSFWAKSEYEVVITSLFRNEIQKKIDVFDQLELNWDAFFKYILEYMNDFK